MTVKFTPGWVLSTCVALALGVLLWLGFWQLERLEEKTTFLAEIETSMKGTPVTLPDQIETPEEWVYKKVTLSGSIDKKQALCIFGRNKDNEMGVFQLAPVTLAGGQLLLTNWGWLSLDDMGNVSCPVAVVDFPFIELTGILRASGQKNSFTPEPDIEGRVWYNFDVDSMQSYLDDDMLLPLLLDSIEVVGLKTAEPIETYMPHSLPNDHLQYAITWLGLALMLMGVYIAFGLQRGRKKD